MTPRFITNDNNNPQKHHPQKNEPSPPPEVAFWTTDYDASQLENGLWPRAAAMAERAWSPSGLVWYTNSSQATQATTTRIGAFRCHLMLRGIAVMPTTVRWDYEYGSNRISEPGSCMVE